MDYPVYRSTVDNLTDGEQRRIRITKSGALRTSSEDANGNVNGTPTNPTYVQQASQAPTAGTDLSGTATTTSGVFNLPANPARRPGDVQGQNVGANTIGFNEFGGTAAIGQPGTYTVPAGATFAITTTNQVNFIAAGGNSAVTITRV